MLNSKKLASANVEIINKFLDTIKSIGYRDDVLRKIMGKKFTRSENLYPRDIVFLRNHLIKNLPLINICDLFLFGKNVKFEEINKILPEFIIEHLIELEILNTEGGDKYSCPVRIGMMDGCYFIADFSGNTVHEAGPIPGLAQEQALLINIARKVAGTDQKSGAIFEVCNGSAMNAICIANQGARLFGTDINPRAQDYASFNAKINGFVDFDFSIGDASQDLPDAQFDIVVANPPYNAFVEIDKQETTIDPTVHGGILGREVLDYLFDNLDSMLTSSGLAFVVSTWLMKGEEIADPSFKRLRESGLTALIRGPIFAPDSLEGLRRLFAYVDPIEGLRDGQLIDVINQRDFDGVCWGVFVYAKGGTPTFESIYNIPTDASLLSPESHEILGKIAVP